jgi:acetate kinase
LLYHGEIINLVTHPYFTVFNAKQQVCWQTYLSKKGYLAGLENLFSWIQKNIADKNLQAIGHRIVHGGRYFIKPVKITSAVFQKIASLTQLDPLHLPHNLQAIAYVKKHFPQLTQVACFDTAFHHTQPEIAKLFAIPKKFAKQGIIRYGFHGLSYEYIASILPKYLGRKAQGKIIVAHLGSGASLCAIERQKSVATTMSFSTLDGLMMATRCGEIDPGVLLYLLQTKKFSVATLENLLYKKSGLLGISMQSDDMRALLKSPHPDAKQAISLFCYRAALAIGAMSMALKGCEAIIFTGGIGERAATIRAEISAYLAWLGVKIHTQANQQNASCISSKASTMGVYVLPTNEELMIAQHTAALITALAKKPVK